MMSDEIEEGELNSDTEICSDKSKHEIILADSKNAEEFKTDCQDSLSCNNPYEEEDEMILELKIKALQSLLEKTSNDADHPKKRPKKLAKRKRIIKKKRIQETPIESEYSNMLSACQSTKPPSLLSLNTSPFAAFSISAKQTNNRFMNEIHTNNFNAIKDNYDLEDMDIETNTQSLPFSNSYNNFNATNISPVYSMTTSSYLSADQPSYTPMSQFNLIGAKPATSVYSSNFFNDWSSSLNNLIASIREINQNHFSSPTSFENSNYMGMHHEPVNYNTNFLDLLPVSHQNLPSKSSTIKSNLRSNLTYGQMPRRTQLKPHLKKKLQQQRNINKKLPRCQNQSLKKNNIDCTTNPNEPSRFISPSSSTSPNLAKHKLPSLMDVDERFIDSTTNKLDIDYRQPNSNNDALIEEEKLLREILINSIKNNNLKTQEKSKVLPKEPNPPEKSHEEEVEEQEEEENDEEMKQLRLKLLDNLNKKRKEKEQQQEKQMDQDFSLLKRKLIEHEQELITAQLASKTSQIEMKNTDSLANSVGFKQRRIKPVIIHLNSNGHDEDDSDEISENESLQQTIGLFLKEAKQQAQNQAFEASSSSLLEKKSTAVVSLKQPLPSISLPNNSENEKKDFIKSIRDKINLNSKEINELTKKSNELKQMKIKKDKDIELTKQKITGLREQLIAAEKILNANEAAANLVKLQQKSIDLKLSKLINTKKTQQAQLQKVLFSGSTTTTPIAVTTKSPLLTARAASSPVQRIVLAQTSQTTQSLTETKPTSVLLEALSEATQPPLPIHPPPPLPPLPPLPQTELLVQNETKPITETSKILSNKKPSLLEYGRKLPVQMTLGGVVAARAASFQAYQSKKRATDGMNQYSLNRKKFIKDSITRPNLFTSKQTDTKLEQLAASSTQTDQNESNQVVKTKVVDSKLSPFKLRNSNSLNKKPVQKKIAEALKDDTKQIELVNRERLNEYLLGLTKSYCMNSHCESLDIWCYESTNRLSFKDIKPIDYLNIEADLTDLPSKESLHRNGVYDIDDLLVYESPLKCFKGYRFSSNFTKLNLLEEAYSKFYCNSIDFRRPFCPFDLHGSCKDSNCVYQHLNVMTMDNYQRTEHFLSYCPRLLNLSTQNPNPKEAVKKLKAYSKTFMNSNLNKMSIKDYFQHLYDHVSSNLNEVQTHGTILSRIPALCLSNNKSLGTYDELKSSHSNENITRKSFMFANSQSKIENLICLFENVLSANMNRTLEVKLKYLETSGKLDIDWLKAEQERMEYFENNSEVVVAWLFYAKSLLLESETSSLQKILNILSHSLELNPKCELIWLIYLKTYLSQSNSLKDYHEICLLCMDNLVTYDLIWFMLNTCPFDYSNLIIERYEKFLLNLTDLNQLAEFEQFECEESSLSKVSFYLCELIVFDCSINLNSYLESDHLLLKYLRSNEIINKLEPNDLCMMWLFAIHLEAFLAFPTMIRINMLFNCRVIRYFSTRGFWSTVQTTNQRQRSFNHNVFSYLNKVYEQRTTNNHQVNNYNRQVDSFLLPWNFKNQAKNSNISQVKYECSIEYLQSLFYEALKAINTRLNQSLKQKARLISLPLYINLICLEISNKRHDIAAKLCERLLKSNDAEFMKELWISHIYIQTCSIKADNQETNDSIENSIKASIKMFPLDAQIVYVSVQYYSSISKRETALELIDCLMKQFYLNNYTNDIDLIFRTLLSLDVPDNVEIKKLNENIDIPKLNAIKSNESQLFAFAICYCYYLQILNVDESLNEMISYTYEFLIKKFKLVSQHTIMWTRYFKFISSKTSVELGYSTIVFTLIKKCLKDLDESLLSNSASSHLIIPFFYQDSISSRDRISSELLSLDNEQDLENSCHHDYYYHNCLVDLWLRLFTRTINDKYLLVKFLIELMPLNTELIKIFINYGTKINGAKITLQLAYNHLILNSIDNENIWILCIKLCLDLNDLSQAILIFQKANQICSKHRSCLFGLNKLIPYLFPSNNSDTKVSSNITNTVKSFTNEGVITKADCQ